jgi:CRISPR-associated endonuclease/helicase Cas3
MNFADFFKAATTHDPFDYQRRLAGSNTGCSCTSRLISVPTGLGKTAGVVLAWLWNQLVVRSPNSAWPRRLVYCLPMRTLVEQTTGNVALWLKNLSTKAGELGITGSALKELRWLAERAPITLMGGEELESVKCEWDLYPECPAILIGTQDMLLSRALNRGYAMSRYRWPMHFGLLNRDALWVLDETQLMGVAVETSAQLDAFRHAFAESPQCKEVAPHVSPKCFTWWMSATLDEAQLATVDHPRPSGGWPTIRLDDADLRISTVGQRLEAKKRLAPATVILSSSTKTAYGKRLAEFVRDIHQSGQLTLIIVNQVARAQEVFVALEKLKLSCPLALVHSRFRPEDRAKQQAILAQAGNRIVVATQAIEAGVDVSARVLVTELAPWSSLVQRFGRCNRAGEFTKGADMFWVDVIFDDDKDTRPYTAKELALARQHVSQLSEASPARLDEMKVKPDRVMRPVLRRKDLLDLFDTTADLCGQDLDISRYIRDGDDTDVQIFWRDLGGQPPKPDAPEASRAELCRVSLGRFGDFMKHSSKPGAFTWNPLKERWEQANRPRPGAIYLLDVTAGGYSERLGWTGENSDRPTVFPIAMSSAEPYDRDPSSFHREWIELGEHTRHVVEELRRLLESFNANEVAGLHATVADALLTAAVWHDVGKAHACFQEALRRGPSKPDKPNSIYAKSKNPTGGCAPPEHRRHFRHEFASALAWLIVGVADFAARDLIAYLIAAHHGKVRLSIRSLPSEEPPADRPMARIARGVLDGDLFGPVAFDGVMIPEIKLDLGLIEMGVGPRGPSWLARMIALRDAYGPFQLAWLETLLRAADMRASAAESGQRSKP